MAGSKKRKTKSKRKATKRKSKPKEMSNIEKLKKMESDLYEVCMKDLDNIVSQYNRAKEDGTDPIDQEEVLNFIEKNGIEKVKIIKGFEMPDGIYDIMVRNWNTLAKVQMIRERTEKANRKLFLREMEQHASELDEKVKLIEDEEKFYTTQPDQEGKVHLKEKWFSEMQYWEEKLAKSKTEEEYKNAQAEIKKLKQKKTWMHMKNIMPNITKWTQKISKGINTVQDSMGEISKPFQGMGDQSFGSGSGSGKTNDYGFNKESVFSGVPDSGYGSKKKKKGNDFFGGFEI